MNFSKEAPKKIPLPMKANRGVYFGAYDSIVFAPERTNTY